MPITLTTNGARICWDDFGNPTDPPLLLIQGLGAHLLGWRAELCQAIADAGFHVIRFDNRDVGESQRFPDTAYTVTDMAEDAYGLLQALGLGPTHVVGQSLGGLIAQRLVLDHPEAVRSLALVYTSPSTAYFVGQDLVEDRMELPVPRDRDEAAEIYVHNEEPCLSPAYAADLGWLRELGRQMFDRGWDLEGVARQVGTVEGSGDRTAELATVSVPTTILHGDGDRLISHGASKALYEAIPDSRLTIYPGMGHELPRALWPQIVAELAENAGRVR